MNMEKIDQRVSEYHSKMLNKRLEEIRDKRNILEEKNRENFVKMTSEEAKKRNLKILQELISSKEQIQRIENEGYSNSRLKIMEKNYWSFVRSMKTLWEREISSTSRDN